MKTIEDDSQKQILSNCSVNPPFIEKKKGIKRECSLHGGNHGKSYA